MTSRRWRRVRPNVSPDALFKALTLRYRAKSLSPKR
jgi:hypothetical protein